MNKSNPHATILRALYDLYRDNKDNKAVTDKVSSIAWALEHDLGFDSQGYLELSELINYGDQKNAADRYVEVIEKSLQNLSEKA